MVNSGARRARPSRKPWPSPETRWSASTQATAAGDQADGTVITKLRKKKDLFFHISSCYVLPVLPTKRRRGAAAFWQAAAEFWHTSAASGWLLQLAVFVLPQPNTCTRCFGVGAGPREPRHQDSGVSQLAVASGPPGPLDQILQ